MTDAIWLHSILLYGAFREHRLQIISTKQPFTFPSKQIFPDAVGKSMKLCMAYSGLYSTSLTERDSKKSKLSHL